MPDEQREPTLALRRAARAADELRSAALDLLDSLGAPHYHDLIGMTYTLRKEQADNLRAALEPASPTPTEARIDLEWAFRLMHDCLQTGKEPEDDEQDRLDEIADALARDKTPTPTEQENDR